MKRGEYMRKVEAVRRANAMANEEVKPELDEGIADEEDIVIVPIDEDDNTMSSTDEEVKPELDEGIADEEGEDIVIE